MSYKRTYLIQHSAQAIQVGSTFFIYAICLTGSERFTSYIAFIVSFSL